MIVCAANICRSPVAERLLLREFEAVGVPYPVVSRGLAALAGRAPHPTSVQVGLRSGLSFDAGKRAAQLQSPDVLAAPLVLVMESAHKHEIARRWPAASGKTWRFAHWEDRDVPDPIGRELPAFIEVHQILETAARSWAVRLKDSGLLAA